MKQLADSVWHLDTVPMPNAVNAFLIGDVLVDAGGRRSGKRILRQLDGHEVTAHAITHAHPDHQGSSDEICTKLGFHTWPASSTSPAAVDPSLIRRRQPDHPVAKLLRLVLHRARAGPWTGSCMRATRSPASR